MTISVSPLTDQTVTSTSSSVSSAPTAVSSAVLVTMSSIILPTASATSTGKSLVRQLVQMFI